MKMLYRIAVLSILFSCFIVSVEGYAQSRSMKDIESRSGRSERALKKSESKKVRQSKEKAEKKQEEQKKKYEKAKKDDTERRMDMQTPETRKQMKEAREKADANNNKGREPFFKRLFKRKKPRSK